MLGKALATFSVGLLLSLAAVPSQAEEFQISKQVQDGLQNYLELVGNRLGYFYVSEDGRFYRFWYCPSHRCEGQIQMRRKAEEDCRIRGKEDCVLVAKGRDIQYDLVLLDSAPQGYYVRDVEIVWEGRYGQVSTQTHVGDGTDGRFFIELPEDDGSCVFAYAWVAEMTGSWSLSCLNGVQASGDYEILGRGKGAVGSGQDNDGNRVEVRIGAY